MGTSTRGVVPNPMHYSPRRDPRSFEITIRQSKEYSADRLHYVEAKSSLEAGAAFIERYARMGVKAPIMDGIKEL